MKDECLVPWIVSAGCLEVQFTALVRQRWCGSDSVKQWLSEAMVRCSDGWVKRWFGEVTKHALWHCDMAVLLWMSEDVLERYWCSL